MNGTPVLYRDQFGASIWARTVRELRHKVGGGRVSKMYLDKVDGPHAGKIVHVGYVVGSHWFTAFAPIERVQS